MAYGASFPASFSLPVDKEKVLANGTVNPKDENLIVDRITWNRGSKEMNQIIRANVILMDILANFNWDRALYFSVTSGPEAYFGLEEYFQLDGMAFRLVPIKSKATRGIIDAGRVNTTTLPDKLLYDFPNHARVDVVNNPDRAQKPVAQYLWGGLNDKRVYHPEETSRMYGHVKAIYIRTANQLAAEGNVEKAEQLLDKLNEIFNPDVIPYVIIGNHMLLQNTVLQIGAFLKLGTPTATEKGLAMTKRLLDEFRITFEWLEKVDERTLTIQSGNIVDFLIRYLSILDYQLTDEHRELLQEDFNQIRLTRSLTSIASQLGAEFDYYLKKGPDAQRQMTDKMVALGQFAEIANMVGDSLLEENTLQLLSSKIDMLSAIDPNAGRMFRNYFFRE